MEVRYYEGRSISEALLKAKIDLGPDAIVLHTKKTKRGGFLGFFGQEVVEIIATTDKRHQFYKQKNEEADFERSKREILNLSRRLRKGEFKARGHEAILANYELKMKEMEKEILSIKKEIVQIQAGGFKDCALPYGRVNVGIPSHLKEVFEIFSYNELDCEIIEELIKKLKAMPEISNFEKEAEKLISELVCYSGGINFNAKGKRLKIVALVGPTGVGKTTTMAKLSANYGLKEEKKVGFITLDTYRIAACEQLERFAEIMSAPVETIFTKEEFVKAIKTYEQKGMDLILIDTAGRNQKDTREIRAIKKFLCQRGIKVDVHLVVSATTKYKDMLDIVEKFDILSPSNIIFTKIDETNSFGPIVNLIQKTGKQISYVTNGQNVPDDIILPDKNFIGKKLMKNLPRELILKRKKRRITKSIAKVQQKGVQGDLFMDNNH